MPKSTIFVQIQGDARVIEISVNDNLTDAELHKALMGAGITIGSEQFVYIDEAEEPVSADGKRAVADVKHGARVHIARCRHIKTTVNYLEKTITREFAPGTRVRSAKKWATGKFDLEHKDAAEHVLQICNTQERRPSDTPLHTLVNATSCAVCFDLVPEKRVEG